MSDHSNIEKIIDCIYKVHEESCLYNDSLENVLFMFTNAYDSFFLDLMKKSIQNARKGNLLNLDDKEINFDLLRHSYRACIKFAFESCKSGVFNPRITHQNILDYEQELKETIEFNFIRNAIDRYRLGKYKVTLEKNSLLFSHVRSDRSIIYDLYSRVFSNSIPGGKDTKDNYDVFNFNLELVNQSLKPQEFQSKKIFKPAKHILLPLIDKLIDYYLRDFHYEIGYLKGKDYCLGDYLLAYSYLAAIGFFKTAYLLSLHGSNDFINQPCIIYPKNKLINDISETTGMSEEMATKAIKDMVYNYEFHKDKVTIFQPLFDFGEYYVCSCNLLFHSYVVDKVMKYFDLEGTNLPDISIYHNYMSEKMNLRMAINLSELYPNIIAYKNCKLTIENNIIAEVDLVVFDGSTKTAALIELKNYTPVENETDVIHKDKKINKAIKSRIEKDKRVLDNLESFFEQNDIPKDFLKYSFSSLLITDSYSGGVNVRERIKVVDEALFYFLLELERGNLKETLNYIESGEFFKVLEKAVGNKYHKEKYSYKGIDVRVKNE